MGPAQAIAANSETIVKASFVVVMDDPPSGLATSEAGSGPASALLIGAGGLFLERRIGRGARPRRDGRGVVLRRADARWFRLSQVRARRDEQQRGNQHLDQHLASLIARPTKQRARQRHWDAFADRAVLTLRTG